MMDSLNQSTLVATLQSRTEPLLMQGLVQEWPLVKAAKQSNAELVTYLKRFDQGRAVDVLNLPHEYQGRMFYNQNMTGFNFSRTRLGFSQALEALLALSEQPEPDSLYVGSTTVDSVMPGLMDENPIHLDELNPLGTLWIGNKSRIAAHYDAPDNLICVAAGKRKVTLFPPEQVDNLYIGPLHFTPAGQAISMVDFHQPDFERFPRFADALQSALTFELCPGDALYIPSMWWHHIEGVESINMLVNFWWRDVPDFVGRSENALYHALLTIKQLPKTQRQAWQSLFAHFVFSDQQERFNHIPEHQQGPLGDLQEEQVRQFRAWLANNLKQ